jgi:uncharacterized phage protein (TIGR02216 family)
VKRVAWPRLMQFGMRELRLSPEVFWGLTPAELMLLAGDRAGAQPLTRAGLAELLARFPDARNESGLE